MKEQETEQRKTESGQPPQSAGKEWHRDVCRGIVMAYFLVMTVIYPFYAPGGYLHLGEVKFVFFRNVSLAVCAVAAAVLLLAALVGRDRTRIIRFYENMSVTDWFAYGYLAAVMVSYLCSAYRREALWGAEGWYMGAAVQALLVICYFLFSRYFHCDVRWIGIWLAASAGVFLLGVCNRYSVYPIRMEGQTETFISTLGNINWFCGYWSVAAAAGFALYWCRDSVRARIAAAVYSVVAMLSGVTQGSGSAYLVFLAVLILLAVFSIGSVKRLHRLLELVALFALSCLLGRIMTRLPGLQYNYGTPGVASAMLSWEAAGILLIIAAAGYALLHILERKGLVRPADCGKRCAKRRGITAALAVAVCVVLVAAPVVGGIRYGNGTPDASGQSADGAAAGVFDEEWGNGRGAAWNAGIDAYRSMEPLHKIVGIGPDCFAEYVYSVPALADRLADQFVSQRLTNAHNERLTLLVNVGMLGWFCYTGLFLTAFVRFVKRADRQPLLYVCAVSGAAYWLHNTVSFQQVLNAPFAFMLLGIGERLCRTASEGSGTDQANRNAAEEYEEKESPAREGLPAMRRVTEYLFAAVAAAVCLALAFYVKDGYHQIGAAKFAVYRAVMIPGGGLLLAAAGICLIFRSEAHRLRLSVADCLALAYLGFTNIAVIAGGFYGDALWGFDGWYMGLMAQISFVLLYFLASRFGKYYRQILVLLCAAACGVYALGILNRLLIDPLGYYDGLSQDQMAQFLSTLGQNTWYASFLIVTLPVGMGTFLYAGSRLWRCLSGIFMAVGFGTLVTQNSDSAYFGLAGALVVFFVLSAGKREQLCRYMASLTLLFAVGKVMGFLMRLHPNLALQPDFVTGLMWDSPVTWALFALCLAATALLYAMGQGRLSCDYPETLMRRLRTAVPVVAAAAVVAAALLIVLKAHDMLPQAVSDGLEHIAYSTWGPEWGNGRGKIWTFSAKLYREMDIAHKLFGVGPDCFHSYVAAHYAEEEQLFWGRKQLSNAHNEWLNMLINTGFFGAAAYLGIFLASVRTALRRAGDNALSAGIAAACVSYMCYNFFCYQQVLCTPFVFLLMGIGAYIDRAERHKEREGR